MHNQHEWTNRAADNRCREHITWEDFTKHPLRAVDPYWRGMHVYWAKGKHHRMQARSSACISDTLMRWYYTSGAKCVHEHEGAWTSNTGNGYYGGFQADLSFASTYGAGYYPPTPDRWTPLAQIHMAYRGWQARGWSPWPNTAAACGLL